MIFVVVISLLGDPVAADPAAAEGLDVLWGVGLTYLLDDKGIHIFPVFSAGHARHLNVGDAFRHNAGLRGASHRRYWQRAFR